MDQHPFGHFRDGPPVPFQNNWTHQQFMPVNSVAGFQENNVPFSYHPGVYPQSGIPASLMFPGVPMFLHADPFTSNFSFPPPFIASAYNPPEVGLAEHSVYRLPHSETGRQYMFQAQQQPLDLASQQTFLASNNYICSYWPEQGNTQLPQTLSQAVDDQLEDEQVKDVTVQMQKLQCIEGDVTLAVSDAAQIGARHYGRQQQKPQQVVQPQLQRRHQQDLISGDKVLTPKHETVIQNHHFLTTQEQLKTDKKHTVTQQEKNVLQPEHAVTQQEYSQTQQEHIKTDQVHAAIHQDHAKTQQANAVVQPEHAVTQQEHDVIQQKQTVLQQEPKVQTQQQNEEPNTMQLRQSQTESHHQKEERKSGQQQHSNMKQKHFYKQKGQLFHYQRNSIPEPITARQQYTTQRPQYFVQNIQPQHYNEKKRRQQYNHNRSTMNAQSLPTTSWEFTTSSSFSRPRYVPRFNNTQTNYVGMTDGVIGYRCDRRNNGFYDKGENCIGMQRRMYDDNSKVPNVKNDGTRIYRARLFTRNAWDSQDQIPTQ